MGGGDNSPAGAWVSFFGTTSSLLTQNVSEVKCSDIECDHLQLSRAEVKNEWSLTYANPYGVCRLSIAATL
jgi:hypothetical protein